MLDFRKLDIESGSAAHEGPNRGSGSVANGDVVLTSWWGEPRAGVLWASRVVARGTKVEFRGAAFEIWPFS